MKKHFIILGFVLLLVTCASKKEKNNPTVISKSSIQTNLEYLASDELQGRNTGTEGIEKAAVFIEDFFEKNGVKPYFKTYRDSFYLEEMIGYNIVGMVEGNDTNLKKEVVILGAHYDHIGYGKKVATDSIANGANDDASGTVAVMEWAKYFAHTKSNKRTILFTLFAAEEMGLKGSAHLAKRLKEQETALYTMLNIEMVGVPRDSTEVMAYITGYEKSNFPQALNTHAGKEIIGYFPKAEEYQLFFRSDNYPFFKEFGIPAHAISTFDFTNYAYYHHVDDEADQMDYEHLFRFVKEMIPALEGISNTSTQEIKLYEP
ncbi:MAG TPA: M20/M25/M40 family metallo-hydrolase [Flavobacteriaceae bacterium]|nr:M20/M25/M40 family metallo-hydrolase [Flavobacteriaceae bacterium]